MASLLSDEFQKQQKKTKTGKSIARFIIDLLKLQRTFNPWVRVIIIYCLAYTIGGTALFANFLPFTWEHYSSILYINICTEKITSAFFVVLYLVLYFFCSIKKITNNYLLINIMELKDLQNIKFVRHTLSLFLKQS